MSTRLLRVGLTGGLACGKSTVLAELAALGAAVVDSDQIARAALAPGSPRLAEVVAVFGTSILRPDGSLDRQALAREVFVDPSRRRRLEAIVHPEVLRRSEQALREHEAVGASLAVLDSPLLFEVGRAQDFHRIVVVACSPDIQLARALARGMTAEDAQRRISAQMPLADKRARADYVIDNDGSREATRSITRAVFKALQDDARDLAAGRPLSVRVSRPRV